MKQSLLLFLSFCMVQASVGQEWQPLYLNETLNYQSSANPDEIIGFFAGDLSNTSDSSDVRIVLDTDSLDDCNCETSCFLLKAGLFQSSISYLANDVVAFQNPDTVYIHTRANLGEAWVFKNDPAGNEVMATVSAVSITEVLGATDSLKTISLSNDEEIHLSKNHGIIKWISATDTLSLFSIPSRGLGDVYLTKAEVYDFNVGDVFSYAIYDLYNDYVGDGWGNPTVNEYKRVNRYEIINVNQNNNIIGFEMRVDGTVDGYTTNNGYSNNFQYSYQDTIYVEIDLITPDPMYDLPDNRYWLKGVDITSEDYWGTQMAMSYFDGSMTSFYLSSAFRMNREMFNNRKMLSYGVADFNFQFNDQTILGDVLDADLNSHLVPDFVSLCTPFDENTLYPGDTLTITEPFPNPLRSGLKLAADGLGVVAYGGQIFGFETIIEYTAVMTGYQKGEEVFGYIPAIDTLLSVGLGPRANQINFSIFPNPADNVIQVQMPTADLGRLIILDISGRELFSTSIASEKMEVETSQYPPGIYFIRVETQSGTGVRKFVVVR